MENKFLDKSNEKLPSAEWKDTLPFSEQRQAGIPVCLE